MTPTPPSTASSSAGAHSPEGQYRVIRKRNRVPVSCSPCRNRKLKCNRAVPCENCVKRNDASSCTYAQPRTRKKVPSSQHSPTTPDDMQNRIDRLEGLVLSLMTNGSQSAGPAAAQAALSGPSSRASRQDVKDLELEDEMDSKLYESDTEQVTKSFGVMKVDSKTQKSYYISEAHWMAVLNDISEVKQYFATHKKHYEDQVQKIEEANKEQDFCGPSLIFGAMKPPSEKEIMSSFPSRYTTDILISRYFTNYDPFTHVIHGPTFQKQYERHWEDPSKTNIVWIGMVFAMLRLAMLSYYDESDEPPEFRGKSLHMAANYRNSMAQCLVLADYTKPHAYLMETLVLHLHADYTQLKEAEVSVWVLVGMIVRLAMRMGYHRDSKMFPNISVFQGEMRRRVWTFIRQADLLFSFQVGLPAMIRSGDSDTELPRNLYDEDFNEDSTELPPERPLNEPAPASYIIAKGRLAFAFGRVLEHTQKVNGSSYEEVMELDHLLRQARDMVPERMAVRPFTENDEPLYVIRARFVIASVYHKAQCVLHRKFLHRARENPRYAYSRRACIDSAMELLRFQSMLNAESKVDPRLRNKKWFIGSGNMHDFLMAGTILFLDLYQELQASASGRISTDSAYLGMDRRQEELAMFKQSRDIWNESKDQSMDAWKATTIMDVLLERLNLNQQQQQQQQNRNNANPTAPMTSTAGSFEPQDEKQNAAMTLGLLSSGLSPMGPTSPPQFGADSMAKMETCPGGGMMDQTQTQMPLSPGAMGMGPGMGAGMFGQLPDMQPFNNLDWEAWDNYLQTATGSDPNSQGWPMSMFDFQGFSPGPLPPTHQSQPQTRPEMGGGKGAAFSSQSGSFDGGGGTGSGGGQGGGGVGAGPSLFMGAGAPNGSGNGNGGGNGVNE
ncbi:hypothetical protein AJ79_04094 [Helicocarpus griseus UAMH5409]|uniref:Zn(2)-C6 fungal-type domain-containing protein n=1 Tax=Helicocarpus griseus UAMH5409 TaxID=1447875 RepID=A0A2B7XVC8_9EURO|nr:hypothetical protein AJ79_04094 [Helicocarpus griseus UAMH5409]